eukprot:PITA_31369
MIPKKLTITSPTFLERLTISKPIAHPDFDLLGELKNLCIKIPLLQAIQDIPIYAKTIKELCVRKPMRKVKTSPTIHVVGTLSILLLGEETPIKYEYPRNPIVTVQIYGRSFPNTLVDLGATINILTTETCQALGIIALEPTTTLLELANRSVVRLEGTLQDITVSIDSWEYPVDFLVINPRSRLDGHPMILGRPWLATTDAYIGYREGSMTITKGDAMLKVILDNEAMEYPLKDTDNRDIQTTIVHNNKPIEIELGKVININDSLDSEQHQKLIHVLQKNKWDFSWDYPDMKGIDP